MTNEDGKATVDWLQLWAKYVPAQQALNQQDETIKRALLHEAAIQFKEVWPDCHVATGAMVLYIWT